MKLAESFASLFIDNIEVTRRARRRVWLFFNDGGDKVEITRTLKWQAPSHGEAMVTFHTTRGGDDWFMKKYLGKVHRGDIITCKRGVQEGSSLV
jgi:hypothetical protein